jgi:predicted unusual protein kinase regulating ubiquinone biosynthesis (AarF/ABC1/UbiB family)
VEGTRIDRLHGRLESGELRLDLLMATLAEMYIKMMLEDGVFHADPHAGNLLVDPQGRLVLLDFGMVLQVERETRRRLVGAVIAAARQDVDGLINAFYELGILDPDVDRGTVRDAARSLMAITIREDVSHRQIQQLVEEVLRTFYEWPLMLPSNLVYFGRAAVLVEGIGLRYDSEFNALAVARPVVARSAGRLIQGVMEQDPRARITDWTQEAIAAVRTLRDLVRRVERDELRVRSHPRDTLELQRFLAQQMRRALLALFAFTVAVITSVVYLATRRLEVLVLGLLIAFGMFLVIFLLPSHLFQNPLQFRRRWSAR